MTSHRPQSRKDRRRACYGHFARRLRQRVSPNINVHIVWHGIIDAIMNNDTTHVSFVGRLNKKGRRLWRVSTPSKPFFVVFDHDLGCPVTVLPPEGHAGCHDNLGYTKISLEDHL